MSKILRSYLLVGFLCLANSFLNAQTTIHSENFSTNTSGTWTATDVIGPTHQWGFTSGYARVNGFGSEDDEDWLISPSLNLNNSTAETFSFKYRNRFNSAAPNYSLELYYTTSYTGDPSEAGNNWTIIPLSPTYTNTSVSNTVFNASPFLAHPNINISAITGTDVRFAFKYFGTATLTKEWQLDDILISGSVMCVTPLTQASALGATPSNTSASISWSKGDGTNTLVLINNTNSFTDPLDGTAYIANATYTGSGQQVTYNGTSSNMTITGLTANTNYYLRVYNFNDCGLPIDYVTVFPLSGSFSTTNSSITTCTDFRVMLKANSFTGKHAKLGYDNARRKMYGVCDNLSNTVTCVYGGHTVAHMMGSTATSIPLSSGIINAEHTVPQSFFSSGDPMVSDMHHLFPTVDRWNSDRGSFPFAEIPDNQTTKWEKDFNTSQTSIPSSNINDYSELRGGTSYEPREIQKGNTARAILYFYTVYEDTMNNTYNHPITDVASIQTLYSWHVQDPPTAADVSRNDCIESFQGNRNPYIDHPEYVAQAFFGSTAGCLAGPLPIELIYFEGKNKEDYNVLSWRTASEKNTVYHFIERKEGELWKEIGQVKAAGHSSEAINYTLNDMTPLPLSIYRLKTVDQDASEHLSKVITLSRYEKAFTLKMYPNPAKDFVTFRTNTSDEQAFKVTITDMTGRVLIQKNYEISIGGLDNHINISSLANGVYFFTFDNGIRKTTERFVRQ
jgi:hypothetical protein